MVFITILYDLGLEMSSETRVKVSWSTPFTSGHPAFELPTYAIMWHPSSVAAIYKSCHAQHASSVWECLQTLNLVISDPTIKCHFSSLHQFCNHLTMTLTSDGTANSFELPCCVVMKSHQSLTLRTQDDSSYSTPFPSVAISGVISSA
jgi:hypothetical protein